MGRRALAAIVDVAVTFTAGYYATIWWGEPFPGGRGWQGIEAILSMVVFASYWVLLEWALGATFGKLLLRLRVVSLTGEECTFAQSLKRNLLRTVDVQFFYLVGYLVAKFNPNRQRLGDLWAGTIVIVSGTGAKNNRE